MKFPSRIYLQVEEVDDDITYATWCRDRINETDIIYILGGVSDENIPHICPTCGAAIDVEASYGTVLVAKNRKEGS